METYENVAPPEYGLPYTLSNDINEILQVSENIYEIEIADIYAESKRTPATVYYCNVLKTLRGAPASEGMIMITFFNDTVIEGERYVVLLSTDEAAPIYLLSSMNSVYTPKQVEEIPELSELMISAKDYTSEHTIHRQSLPQRGAKVTDKIPF